MLGIQRTANASISIAAATLLASVGFAQLTEQLSVSSAGAQSNGPSYTPVISNDGRFVVFTSAASNLVPGDTNNKFDAFVRDRQLGTTIRVSVDSNGAQGNDNSGGGQITPDGRYVVFASSSSNLVPGDTNNAEDVFVHDNITGTTRRISVDSTGAEANGDSFGGHITPDGRYVLFGSLASNLVPGDTNNQDDVFVRDLQLGTTTRVNVASNGAEANHTTSAFGISDDGRYVVFQSFASNLVAGDTNSTWDIFVHDNGTGATWRVSVDSNGAQANGFSQTPSISANGHLVVFESSAPNLVAGDANQHIDVFLHDLQSGQTSIVSVSTQGTQGNGDSRFPSISKDGRWVVFKSTANNLVPSDPNSYPDVFVRDLVAGATTIVSVSTTGTPGNGESAFEGTSAISGNGRFVAFDSNASDLVPNDTNLSTDIFLRDQDSSGATSLCDPGVAGVIACPCSNPPSGPGRGCDNSSTTGGAALTASGIAYLSIDSLVFTSSDEKPAATSIVMQGDALAASGLVFGQGVRCVGGALKRLYTKTAVGGGITAPQGGDPTVSARSAALGDTILAGESRWYLVYYRDPIVLGGCPAASTFNATQTAQITWSL
jgi:Tol biopolymer transport system component